MSYSATYHNQDGVKRHFVDTKLDSFKVYTEVDLEETIQNNKAMSELHPQKSVNKMLARGVPLTVWEQSVREKWEDKDWKRWLNDPDNAAFRVWKGWV